MVHFRDPNWQGHEPGDGAVYNCYQPQTDLLIWIWSQDPPPNSGVGPTPREVAQIAIEQMDLRAIDIGITPENPIPRLGRNQLMQWMLSKSIEYLKRDSFFAWQSIYSCTLIAKSNLRLDG